MRRVTLEEHLSFPELTSLIPAGKHQQSPNLEKVAPALADITGKRLADMDENGITMQVLSVAGPGADLLNAEEGPAFARQYNDLIAEKISGHTDRFAAFAHLPMTNAEAAADELERTVNTYHFAGALINGMTQDQFLDHPKFAPLLERAQQLNVPLYLHPGVPPQAVKEAYYGGLPNGSGDLLSLAGWGWHAETALHVLRLIISGTLDRYPDLKIIIGHMGEMLPMMMSRCDHILEPGKVGINQRSITETLRAQVYITTSGIFTTPPLMTAIETLGIDNIMFSVDYPFSTNAQGKEFLDHLDLPAEQLEKLAFRNAERILGFA